MGIDPEYVLDKMKMYEVKTLLKYQHYKVQEDWEQTRMMGYITAQVNSTKTLKMTDIIKFPWEEKHTVKEMSDEELNELKAKAQAMIDNKFI